MRCTLKLKYCHKMNVFKNCYSRAEIAFDCANKQIHPGNTSNDQSDDTESTHRPITRQ